MEYLKNLYSQSDFSNEKLSNAIHSLQVEIISDSVNHYEKKNNILAELYQIAAIPANQTKMTPSRWDELRFNIYLFIASTLPNYKLIPNLNLDTKSKHLFYIMNFLHPYNIFLIYNQLGVKNDDFSQSTVPSIMPPDYYTKEQSISVLIKIFESFTQSIMESQTTSFEFYTISELSYGFQIPSILLHENPKFIEDQRYARPFRFIKGILSKKNEGLTDENDKIILSFHVHHFLYELIRFVHTRNAKELMNEIFQAMAPSIRDIQISSITIPLYFHVLFSNKNYSEEKIATIEALYQNSLLRVNDVFKNYPIYQIFESFNSYNKEFLEHKTQPQRAAFYKTVLINLMHFICQIFNGLNPQEIYNSRRKTSSPKPDQEFLKNLFNLFNEFRWPFLFFVEKIISELTFYARKMNIIKAIKIRDSQNKNMCIENTISFNDQLSENDSYIQSKEKQMTSTNSNSIPQPTTGGISIAVNINGSSKENEIEKEDSTYTLNCYMNKINENIDDLLFSAFECRSYTSFEEALNAFERLEKIYDSSKKVMIPLSHFGYYILRSLLQNEQSSNRSTLVFYLERLLRAIFNFIIYSSYRYMLLSTFTKTQQLYRSRLKNQSLPRSPPEYSLQIAKSIGEIINTSKSEHPALSLVASILAECLFNAMKKQVVTSHCTKCILTILRSQSSSLYNLLLPKMMEILYSNCLLSTSYDNSKAILFQQWLFLIIKIGGKKAPMYPPNSTFAQLLRNYQHTFFSNFFNRNNRMNQPEMILTFIKYIKAMKANLSDLPLKQLENPESKTILKYQKYFTFHDFRQENIVEALTLFLDRAVFDYSDNLINPSLINQAFLSENIDIMKIIINIFSKYLSRAEYIIDYETESTHLSFNDFLKPINRLPKDLAFQLIELIPKVPPIFTDYSPLINFSKKGYCINIDPEIDNFYKPLNTKEDEEFEIAESDSIANIEYIQILSSINRNSARTKTEAKHLIMLFSILIDSKQILKFSLNDLEKTLDSLFIIARFTELRPQVEFLIKKMNKLFTPIITDPKSNNFDYVYAFTFSFIISQTESSQYAIQQFKSFLYEINLTNYLSTKIADKLFSNLKLPHGVFNTLLLFTILEKKRAGCIKLDHFTSLLALIKDQSHMTQITCQLFKKFLKLFIQNLSSDQKSTFMTYCTTIVHNRFMISNSIKLIIIKKLPLLKIPFDHYDPNFYKNANDELFYNIMSIIVGCGSRIPLTQELVDHSIKHLNMSDPKQPNAMQSRFTFISLLTKAKINIDAYFKDDAKKYFGPIFNFLIKLGNPQCSKYINWVNSKNPEIIKLIHQKESDFFSESASAVIRDEKKFRNFLHFLGVLSDFIEPNHLVFTFNAISEIIKIIKISLITYISNLFKMISSFNYSRQELRSVVLSPSQVNPQISYLGQFMTDVCKFFLFTQLPVEEFIKYRVVNFLLNFKMETIRFIFLNSVENEAKYFNDILYNMIISDETNETFDLFIQSINPVDQYSKQVQPFPNHHPYVFEIETKLSEESKYATNELFKELVKSQFNIFFNRKQNKILTDNDSNQLNSIVNTFINIMSKSPDFINLVNLSSFFAIGSNVYTSLYLKFKNYIFANREKQFYIDMFQNVLNECAPNFDEDTNQIPDDSVNLLEIDRANIFNTYRFTTNSTTAIILSNLIKGIGPFPVETDAKIFNHLIATLICMLTSPVQRYTAMKCFYTLFKNNQKLLLKMKSELTKVIYNFKSLLEQSEPYPIILALKFAIKLLKNDLLPDFVLSDILKHIFAFPKLIEQPYSPIVTSLFSKANQFYSIGKHNSIPESLSTAFKSFAIEKIVTFKDIDKLMYTMKFFPSIAKTIPFSVLSSLIHIFDLREKEQIQLLFSNFDRILKFYQFCNDVPEQIQVIFNKIAIDFLLKHLDLIDKEHNFQVQLEQQLQNFLGIAAMLMKQVKAMPEKVLFSAISKIHHGAPAVARYCQVICVLSTEFFDEQLLNAQSKAIIESFELLLKDGNLKQIYQYVKFYVTSIFNRPKLTEDFAKHFLSFLDNYPNNPSPIPLINKFEAAQTFLISYAKETKHNDKLQHLECFWKTVNGSTITFMRLWIFNYLDVICELPIEQQMNLFDFIITNLKNSSTPIPFNISVLKSSNVKNRLKLQYLKRLIKVFPTLSYDDLFGLLKFLNESSYEFYSYKIICYLHLIMKASDEGRLIHIDELQRILGKNEEERFISLFNFVPPKLWKNSNLVFIVLIIMKHTKIIKPLAMLAGCFEPIASKFAIPLFTRIMNAKTVSMFHELLRSSLSNKKSNFKSKNYSELICSITNSYSLRSSLISNISKGIRFKKMPPNLLYKSVKITNDNFLFFDNLSLKSAQNIPDKLLLPHIMNDEIFSLLPENSPIESLSASAQFFLSNYNESSKIFSAYDTEIFNPESSYTPESSPQFMYGNRNSFVSLSVTSYNNDASALLGRMMDISNYFVSKEGTFHVFERLGHEDQIIPCLENALNSINISASDNAANAIYIATTYNILYFKHHQHPSIFEYQRLISIGMILELMNRRLSFNSNKVDYLSNIQKLTQPNLNQQSNMLKKTPQPTQHQINLPPSFLRIPSVYIKSIFFPIYSSFFEKFQEYLFSSEIINAKSKENQLSNVPLNLNIALRPNVKNSFDISDSSTVILSHEYRDLFDSVIDVNSYGFFSVTMSQINSATEMILRSINSDKFKQQSGGVNPNGNFYNDLIKPNSTVSSVYKKESAEARWPGFCFSLLTSSSILSSTLHQAALQGYYNLAKKSSVAFFIHESYYARILTLIGLSIVYLDDTTLLSNSMKYSESIFKDKIMPQYAKFWGSQIAFLITHPRFSAQLTDILKPYLSLQQTMHSHNLCKKPFTEQIEIINLMNRLFSLIFEISTNAFDYNEEDEEKSTNNNEIDNEKCTEKYLNFRSIEIDLDNEVKNDINKISEMINQRLPVDFELSIPFKMYGSKIRFSYINRDFTKISNNVIAFTAILSNSTRQLFFVEKVKSTDSVMSFANSLYLLKQMMKYSYTTRSRNIRISAPLPIEIGEGMIMYPFPNDAIPISRFRFCDFCEKDLKESISSVSHIVPFFLKQFVIEASAYEPKTFIEMRKKLISNFAAYSAIRSIFQLDQPSLDQLYISFKNIEFPFILSHFTIPKEYSRTATTIPPILLDFFSEVSTSQQDYEGEENQENDKEEEEEHHENDKEEDHPIETDENSEKRPIERSTIGFERKFEMSFAAVHQSITSYIDTFRSIIEMPIQDSLHTVNKQIDNILASRDLIEASLFDYAPPFSDGASPSDSVEWFKRIQEFYENSKSPFERTKEENPRAISIPPPSTTLLPTPSRDNFSLTPNQSSSSILQSTAGEGLGLGDDFGAFDINLSSFGDSNSTDIGVSVSSMNQNSGLSAMNSMGSFNARSPINTNNGFDNSQEISRNNSLLGFRNNSNELPGNNQNNTGILGSNSFDFGGGFDQSQQQLINMQLMQTQNQQQQQQQQPFFNRINSFDSSGMIGGFSPQPVPKVVSPQIQVTQPMTQPPPQQQQQQQQQQMQQMSNDFGGNDDQEDLFSFF